jgi:hypothetical protein
MAAKRLFRHSKGLVTFESLRWTVAYQRLEYRVKRQPLFGISDEAA